MRSVASRRHVATLVVLALSLTGAIALSAGATAAAAAAEISFGLSPSSGVPGSTTNASDGGGHCNPGDTVTISAPFGVMLTATADGSGAWSVPVTVPVDAQSVGALPISASCPGNLAGYALQSFGITPTVTPISGYPSTSFNVSWYCVGLATLAVTVVGSNAMVSSSSVTANGAVNRSVLVPPALAPSTLRIVATCASSYSGYGGYSGYAGYGGAVTFAPAFFDVLAYPSAIEGTVTGDGVPLVGFLVQVCPTSGICQQLYTDVSGHYRAGAIQGTHSVFVFPPVGSPFVNATDLNVVVPLGSTVTKDFALVRAGTITGTVTRDGNPVAFSSVSACAVPPVPPLAPGCRLGFTNSLGQYAIPGLAPGSWLVSAGGAVPTPAGQVVVTSGATTTVDIAITNPSTISGTVTGTGGASLAGQTMVFACPAPFHLNPQFQNCPGAPFSTGASTIGTLYTLGSLGAGTWNLRAFNGVGAAVQLSPEYTITLSGTTSLTGVDFTIGDAANVAPVVEDGAPPPAGCSTCVTGDGNGDGIADSLQPEVVSLPSAGPGLPYVTIAGPGGSVLADVVARAPSEFPSSPPGAPELPFGVIDFELRNVPVAGAADVTIWFPEGIAADHYYKFDAGVWSDFSDHVSFFSDRVVLHLVDGGAGDGDHQANGVIDDPGALGFAPPIAMPDQYSTSRNGMLDVAATGVLSNDVHVEDGSAVLVSGPVHGQLELRPDGSFRYTPVKNFVGTDHFTYALTRGGATSDPVVVTLSVNGSGSQCDLSQYAVSQGQLQLQRVNLSGCYLAGAQLQGADLTDANLIGADLTGADLSGARLRKANLRGVDLTRAVLTGADLRQANLADVIYVATVCPDGTLSDDDGSTCAGHTG